MGIFDRVEAKLEKAVNGVFARAFRAEVQPVEIASAIRRAMDDRVAVLGKGRTFVPNLFTIELSSTDYGRLGGYGDDLEEELIAAAQEHAESQRYHPAGTIRVNLTESDDLETGVFRVRPQTAKHTGLTGSSPRLPQQRPGRSYAEEPPSPSTSGRRGASGSPGASGAGAGSGAVGAAGVGAGAAGAGAAARGGAAYEPYDVEADERRQRQRSRRSFDEADEAEPTQRHDPMPVAGAPRRVNPADRPWLDIDGERYPLMGALTIVGRDDSADIILDDPGISRRHSEIRVTADGPHFVTTIRDLDSTNGTFVNGERVVRQRLEPGDRITVGRTNVTFRAGR